MLGSGRDLHYSVLMLIAAQYVFTSVMDELDIHPELKADVGIMLYSVSVSRLLLRVMKKESVALYIHMTEENVVFIPRDQASKTILKSWDCPNEVRRRSLGIDTDTVAKDVFAGPRFCTRVDSACEGWIVQSRVCCKKAALIGTVKHKKPSPCTWRPHTA